MRERVLAIVNLIAKYVLGAENTPISEQELIVELMSVGFEADEINDAFSWMETVALQQATQQGATDDSMQQPSLRLYTAEERATLSPEAIGFLVRLRSMGMLGDEVQEEVIDRALQAAEDTVTLQEIKLIAALTLLSRADNLWQREIDCFMSNDWERIYH